jgi:hypothetical protein
LVGTNVLTGVGANVLTGVGASVLTGVGASVDIYEELYNVDIDCDGFDLIIDK